MNPLTYFQDLLSNGTMGSYFSMCVWGILILSIISGLIFGLKRGFSKTVVRTVTVAAAAIASFIIAINVDGWITGYFYGKSIEEAIISVYPSYETQVAEEIRNVVSSFDPETAGYICRLVLSLVVVPTVFSVIFSILNAVCIILYWILVGILGLTRRRKGFVSTLLGSVMGMVQGLLIAAVVLLPIAGFTTLAKEFKESATRDDLPDSTEAQVTEFYGWWLDGLIENPVLNTIEKCGGNILFDRMTETEMGEESIDSGEQAKNIVKIYIDGIVLYNLDWKSPDAPQRAALEDIVADIGEDEYNATVVSGLFAGLSKTVDNGSIAIPLEEPYSSLIQSVVDIFDDSNSANLEGDLDTMLHVYFILAENGVLSSLDNKDTLQDCLIAQHNDNKTVIDYVIDELTLNNRTAPVVSALTKISVTLMCESMGMSEDATVIYENVKSGMNDVLALNESDFDSREEYVSAVEIELDTTLKENNIELDSEIVSNMADYIAENYSDTTEITDEDINKAILSYYNAYVSGNTDETPPDLGDLGDLGGLGDSE